MSKSGEEGMFLLRARNWHEAEYGYACCRIAGIACYQD